MVWLIGKMLKGEKETRILASCLLACLDKEIEAGGYRTEADKKIALEIMDLIGKTAQKRLTKNSIKEFSKVLDKNFRSYQKLYYCSESLTDRVFSIVDIVRYRTNRTGLIAGYVVNHLVSSSACANIIRGWEWYPKPPKLIIKGK